MTIAMLGHAVAVSLRSFGRAEPRKARPDILVVRVPALCKNFWQGESLLSLAVSWWVRGTGVGELWAFGLNVNC